MCEKIRLPEHYRRTDVRDGRRLSVASPRYVPHRAVMKDSKPTMNGGLNGTKVH